MSSRSFPASGSAKRGDDRQRMPHRLPRGIGDFGTFRGQETEHLGPVLGSTRGARVVACHSGRPRRNFARIPGNRRHFPPASRGAVPRFDPEVIPAATEPWAFPVLLSLAAAILFGFGNQCSRLALRFVDSQTAVLWQIGVSVSIYWLAAPFYMEAWYWTASVLPLLIVLGCFRPLVSANLGMAGDAHPRADDQRDAFRDLAAVRRGARGGAALGGPVVGDRGRVARNRGRRGPDFVARSIVAGVAARRAPPAHRRGPGAKPLARVLEDRTGGDPEPVLRRARRLQRVLRAPRSPTRRAADVPGFGRSRRKA